MQKREIKFLIVGLICSALIAGCGGEEDSSNKSNENSVEMMEESVDPMLNKGIGPISSVELVDVNKEMATQGEEIFNAKCVACHKMGVRLVGPDLTDVIERRTPEWIMNMILNPEEMVKEDPIAQQLLKDFTAPMVNQHLTEDETRKILEYFRK